MNKSVIRNYRTAEGQPVESNGNCFTVKPVVPLSEAKQCQVNFVEVAPGNYAYGYHWHEMNEEVFYIIEGRGIVRTATGEVEVKAGDAITFPPGPEGTHVIRNASETERLVYIDFDTNNPAEIVHLPEVKKIMAIGPFSNAVYDEQ
ncbi:cupin domain-containing protein [Victivallis sp. Marseille-Q1083]|uniref:cupin domain-containing protein n=1 Tax=Victivallis sp. Marseille-Q1083 TaxID=2717288 RepID=UPI00158DB0CF|nr:cupin domain-containing protein [Victivallis sp. Marseille-Q1083]